MTKREVTDERDVFLMCYIKYIPDKKLDEFFDALAALMAKAAQYGESRTLSSLRRMAKKALKV